MATNPHITLVQLEQALNSFQNGIYDDKGEMQIDERWIEVFDGLLSKMIESRSLVDLPSTVDWKAIVK